LGSLLPQLNLNYLYQHNFQVPTNIINGTPIPLGVGNTSALQFQVAQNIFSQNLYIARASQGDTRLQATQLTTSQRIDVVSNVTKAFYDIISTAQRIEVTQQDIVRLERSLKDAYAQYQAGVTDKIDYKRATIELNNTKADLRSSTLQVRAKTEYLKQLMGYPATDSLRIVYDSAQLEREAFVDTLQRPDYTRRIEYELLQTERRLLEFNVKLAKLAFLPSVSLNAGYNFSYQNSNFGKLYGNNFPASFGQLVVTLPIYQGGKRKADLQAANYRLKRNEWDVYNLRNTINSEYEQAKANYEANYVNYQTLRENLSIAQEVYDVIQLQYRNGIKAYLEVVTAETSLRAARLNYFDALYQLLSTKVDIERSLGIIRF
jgi:outer membrane protein TolC